MALLQNITHDTPLTGEVEISSYVKVMGYSGNKEQYIVDVHWLKDSADGVLVKSQNYVVSLNLNGDNPIKQAYEYLKTLSEFENAVDC